MSSSSSSSSVSSGSGSGSAAALPGCWEPDGFDRIRQGLTRRNFPARVAELAAELAVLERPFDPGVPTGESWKEASRRAVETATAIFPVFTDLVAAGGEQEAYDRLARVLAGWFAPFAGAEQELRVRCSEARE